MQQLKQNLTSCIADVQRLRKSTVLVLAASNLDMEMLPPLYRHLEALGKCDTLDVVLHGRGGVVNAARRIALLLRAYCNKLNFIVPYYCESAATVLALAGDTIVAGNMAIFSPIDPQLHGGSGDTASTMSSLDVKYFTQMSQEWFGVPSDTTANEALSALCSSIFPPTLTAFYRTTKEMMQVAQEMLSFQFDDSQADVRTQIAETLMFNYHSHNYAISVHELKALGLNCVTDDAALTAAWLISEQVQACIGGSLRSHQDDPWYDVMLASSAEISVRQQRMDGLMPAWVSL